MADSYSKLKLLEYASTAESRALSAHRLAEERHKQAAETTDPKRFRIAASLEHIARVDALHEERKADLFRTVAYEIDDVADPFERTGT